MDARAIVEYLDPEVSRLQQARSLLTGHTMPLKRWRPFSGISSGEETPVSAEGGQEFPRPKGHGAERLGKVEIDQDALTSFSTSATRLFSSARDEKFNLISCCLLSKRSVLPSCKSFAWSICLGLIITASKSMVLQRIELLQAL
jgi:hypothetical protein